MWEDIETAWVERTGGVPFHATDCEGNGGAYRHTPPPDNQALYRDLTTLLASSQLAGWGIAINLIAQRIVFPDAPDLSYYKGFSEVISAMLVFAKRYEQSIKFTFDMRLESNFNSAMLYKMYYESPSIKVDMLDEVAFASSQKNPRIQIADLWVRECMKALDNQIGPVKRAKRKSWAALESTGRFAIDAIGEEWFLSLRDQLPALQRETGFHPVEYRQWLNMNKLQDNTTNQFRFFDWTGKQRKT